jgi:murein L,D-transpeptidase YafK
LGSLALLSNACSGPPQTAVGEPELWVEPGIPVVVAEEPPACLQIVRVEVWKQERILRAYCKRGAVVAMDVALGRDESGPKRSAGDQRTPEGRYQTVETARQGRFHLFIPIDYPSREDAAAARAEGRLTELDYQRIMHAHELALLPPHQTPLGGDLGFHGEGERWRGDSRYLNWTYGCIALPDDEIDFLAERLRPGVPVWIHP